ncbi:hypothetical protein GQ457_HM001350 [Hibiscus cannabinus]
MTWCKSSSESDDPSTLDRVVTGSNPGRALKGTSPPPFLSARQSTKGEKKSLSLIQISPSRRSSRRWRRTPMVIPAIHHHQNAQHILLLLSLEVEFRKGHFILVRMAPKLSAPPSSPPS